ncbi:MAG: hypothetical protein WC346_05475 [Methanogenium sp.]|jgi:hypothetical protein
MSNKTIERIKKEAQKEAQKEIAEELKNASKYPVANSKSPRLDENTKQPIIEAKDATIGKCYLTVGGYYKVTILKKYGDEEYVPSVQIQAEGEYKPINVAGGTELIEYKDEFYKPRVVPKSELDEETDTPNNSKEKHKMSKKNESSKPPKATKPEQPQPKMSDIIVPMLAVAKHTAAEIADAVIEKFPEKKAERDKLISQIAGPRLYNLLKNKAQWQNGKTPGLKEEAASKPKKDEKPSKGKDKVKKEKKASSADQNTDAPVPPAVETAS